MIKETSINRFCYPGLVLLAWLLAACCPDSDQKLDGKIGTWAPYGENQEIIFHNENQDSIRFKVKRIQRTETGYDRVCGSYDIETAEAILINEADTAFQFKISLTQEVLVKLDSYYRQPPAKNVSAMFNSISEHYVSFDWRDRYYKDIIINGKAYKEVLHIYGNTVPNTISFVEIYYAKNIGLIAFSNGNGWFYLP